MKLNPLTLILLNSFFPIVIFLGKGNIVEFGCFISSLLVVLSFHKVKAGILFSSGYFMLWIFMKGIQSIALEFITLFFGISVYILLRMMPVIMIAWVLTSCYTSNELLSALVKLRLPKKIILSVTIMLRFFPTYRAEITLIKESLKMRQISLSIFKPVRYLEFLLVPILIRASMIAEDMTANAITKGVESTNKRTSFYPTTMNLLDYGVLVITSMVFVRLLIRGGLIV